MTATERLRAILDERGVEWWQSANTLGCIFTRWYSPLFGDEVCAMENGDGELELFSHLMTPEQAVAATLGAGTCKPREVRSRFSKTQEYVTYHCKCGHELGGYMTAELPFPHTYNEDELPNYCPNCGRRIAEEDE